MTLEGSQLRFARGDDGREPLERALDLAKQVESLLEEDPTPSRDPVSAGSATGPAHSTRIARAMAASLVDELEGLVRGARRPVRSG